MLPVTEIDPKLSDKIVKVLTNRSQQDPSALPPIVTALSYNVNQGFATGSTQQTLVEIDINFDSGASPTSQQLYTVPTGKKFYLAGMIIGTDSGARNSFLIRDATADSGTIKFHPWVMANTNIQLTGTLPIKTFTTGLRVDAANIQALVGYRGLIWGWLEDV